MRKQQSALPQVSVLEPEPTLQPTPLTLAPTPQELADFMDWVEQLDSRDSRAYVQARKALDEYDKETIIACALAIWSQERKTIQRDHRQTLWLLYIYLPVAMLLATYGFLYHKTSLGGFLLDGVSFLSPVLTVITLWVRKPNNGFVHLLARYPDVRLIGPLIDLLGGQAVWNTIGGEGCPYALIKRALTQVLPELHRADVPALDTRQRDCLRRALERTTKRYQQRVLAFPDWEADFLVAVLNALEMESLRNPAIAVDEELARTVAQVQKTFSSHSPNDPVGRRVCMAAEDFLLRRAEISLPH